MIIQGPFSFLLGLRDSESKLFSCEGGRPFMEITTFVTKKQTSNLLFFFWRIIKQNPKRVYNPNNRYTNTDDEKLFALIEQGSEEAFTQAYNRYHKLLYAVAYRYLMSSEMAEDVVQHVFTRLWEFRSELRVGISLKNYLFTMTKNHVLNFIRNENTAIRRNYEIAQSALVYEDNLIENLEKKELMDSFYKAVDMLPSQKKEICLMKVQEELTNQEIAKRMNLSVNTIKTHYSEALKLLRIHLGKMLIIVTIVTLMTCLSVHYLR